MYKGNVQQENLLCAASCVTVNKNISLRCKFSNLANTPMYSSRLYAKNPVFETVDEESAKVYHLPGTHVQREYSETPSMRRTLCD